MVDEKAVGATTAVALSAETGGDPMLAASATLELVEVIMESKLLVESEESELLVGSAEDDALVDEAETMLPVDEPTLVVAGLDTPATTVTLVGTVVFEPDGGPPGIVEL